MSFAQTTQNNPVDETPDAYLQALNPQNSTARFLNNRSTGRKTVIEGISATNKILAIAAPSTGDYADPDVARWKTAGEITGLTHKGDILTSDGTTTTVLPVGTDGYSLVANSAAPNGIEWALVGGGGAGVTSIGSAAAGAADSGGSGLHFSPNPIIGVGTIGLAASGVTPATYPALPSKQTPQITVDSTGRATSISSVAIDPTTINVSANLTTTQAVLHPGDTTTLDLADTTVIPGSYGNGTNVATIVFDAKGRATTATNTPILSSTINTTTPIAGGGAVAPGGSLTLTHAPSGALAGVYGNAAAVAQFTVNATGHITSATNVPITGGSLGSITVNPIGPLIITGSPVSLGGTLTIQDTALLSINTRCWAAGTGATTLAATDATVTGDGSTAGGVESCVYGSTAGGTGCTHGSFFGFQAGGNTPGADLCAFGWKAGKGLNANNSSYFGVAAGPNTVGAGNAGFGNSALFSITTGTNNAAFGHGTGPTINVSGTSSFGAGAFANGSDSIAMGMGASTTSLGAVSLGRGAQANAQYATAIGHQVVNAVASTTLIGESVSPLTHVVKSTGLFQSAVQQAAACGRVPGDALQTYLTLTQAIMNIYSTRYSDAGLNVQLNPSNYIELPVVANCYSVSLNCQFSIPATSNNSYVTVEIMWSSDGGATLQQLAIGQWTFNSTGVSGGVSLATAMKTTGVSPNRIYGRLTNNTTQTLSLALFRLAATRIN